MKRVLLICYYFPPLGGAGVARPLGLYKHLPMHGWECDVLAVKNVAYRSYEPELLDGLDTSHIYRAGSTDPQRLLYLLGMREVKDRTFEKGRSFAESFFPDSKVGWVRSAVRLGRTLASNRKYDAMISTSPPMSSHLVGLQLAKECRIPWIADFRDFWHAHPAEQIFEGSKLDRALDLLKQITTMSAELTAVNASIQEYFGRGEVIMNSVELEFISLWQQPQPTKDFIIGVLGTLNEFSPIEPLLQLLARYRQEQPELFQKIKVIYIGIADTVLLNAQLQHYQLTDIFTYHGAKNRKESIRLLQECSLLHVAMPAEKDKVFSTGRIFTLLASGRPILAAAPENSEVARLVQSSEGGGALFLPNRLNGAITYLTEQIKKQQQGILPTIAPLASRLRYSSESMAEQFAAILNRIST